MAVLLGLWPLAGCAIVGPSAERAFYQSSIRKHGYTASRPDPNPVLETFHDLAVAGGLDPAQTRIGFEKGPELKAASIGGHYFVVTAPVVEVQNPCLVWGIVAHEVAHDMLGHADRQVATSTGIGVVATAASFFLPGAGYLVQGAGWLGMQGYSRSQEAEADAQAVALLEKAGRPRWSLGYALRFIRDVYGDRGGSWVHSHPLTSERIASQPLIDDATAEELCGPTELREAQVEMVRQGLTKKKK